MNNLMRLIKQSKGYFPLLTLCLILSILSSVGVVISPLLLGKTIDLMVMGNTNFKEIFYLAMILVTIYISAEILGYLSSIISGKVSENIKRNLRTTLFSKIQKLPINYLYHHSTGDTISRMSMDIENVGVGLLQGMLQLFKGVGVIVGTIIVMYMLSPIVATVIVALTPISIVLSMFLAKKTQKYYTKNAVNLGKTSEIIMEQLGNQKTVVANAYETTSVEKFEEINKKTAHSYFLSYFLSSLTNPSSRLINNGIYIVVGIVGIALKLHVGVISSFLLYSNQFAKPFTEITTVIADLQNAVASLNRVYEILDEAEVPSVKEEIPLDESKSDVIFKDVFFSYEKGKTLIENFNLSVKTGETIAIVGGTGAGKTTIINLLLRFYELNSGSIKINGINIKELSYPTLRNHISVVLQDSFIKNATVFENIAFGNQKADKETVANASKKAMCYDIIKSLPKGFDTIISPDDFSKGQLQLFAIARAMVENAPILVLDEATSSIDSLTEIKVQNAFKTLMKNKTTFVIAHRLSTIKKADKILVMEKGNIIEMGNHKTLMDKNGAYRQLVLSQYKTVNN